MKNLSLSLDERDFLTKIEYSENSVPIFFPHAIGETELEDYWQVWDQILAASEVDPRVIEKVRTLLPTIPIDVRADTKLQTYNCFTAALHTLGVKGFTDAIQLITLGKGMVTLPVGGEFFFDRESLGATGFVQVEKLQEKNCRGLVLLESSMGHRSNHTAVYLGSSDGMDLYFHKPQPCVPDIKPLEKILEACAHGGGRRPRAEITYTFWQRNKPGSKAMTQGITPKVYNAGCGKELAVKDPRASIINGFDVTPTVLYHQGKAIGLVDRCCYNGGCVALSIYAQTPDGRYAEWHEDPEHGDWPQAAEVSIERLKSFKKGSRRDVAALDILGKSREEVQAEYDKKKKFAYHQEAKNTEIFGVRRPLLAGRE